jgi:uncharacterized membrane protein (TIGR02234 family)
MADSRRAYAIALLLLALGGGLLLWSSASTWAQAQVPLAGLESGAMRVLVLTGRDLAPVASVMGVAAWAGIPGLVATRGWGRPILGVLIAAAGVAAVGACVSFGLSPSGRIDQVASADAGATMHVQASWAGWWLAGAMGGVLVVAAGAAAVMRGRGWPSMGSRYERQAAPRDPWAQLDAGLDPTVDSD